MPWNGRARHDYGKGQGKDEEKGDGERKERWQAEKMNECGHAS